MSCSLIRRRTKSWTKCIGRRLQRLKRVTQTVRELEEAVLAGGAAANAVRDYQRKVHEMNEERKTLEWEVACAKVTANRVATVVANEWKDANDKGEMQQLCDKLAVAERTTQAEAQLKEKYQMQFKVLEERLKTSNDPWIEISRYQMQVGKIMCPPIPVIRTLLVKTNGTHMESANGTPIGNTKPEHEDYVSGMLYDMLQKEVVSLRKACNERDQTLKEKDDAIEMLAKKVDTLKKAMEVEAKKMRREVAVEEKEVAAIHVSKEHDQRMRHISTPRGAVNSSHLTSARNAWNP
ncbi:hypothetical protein SO802_032091 [Lithocarpus litseifolius]|uniref:Uncharacterized protein n=1 Tax=Lithocarpus litseifolius TaxID=425828 RepID=A0AAW2BMF0_9ROSI